MVQDVRQMAIEAAEKRKQADLKERQALHEVADRDKQDVASRAMSTYLPEIAEYGWDSVYGVIVLTDNMFLRVDDRHGPDGQIDVVTHCQVCGGIFPLPPTSKVLMVSGYGDERPLPVSSLADLGDWYSVPRRDEFYCRGCLGTQMPEQSRPGWILLASKRQYVNGDRDITSIVQEGFDSYTLRVAGERISIDDPDDCLRIRQFLHP